MATPVPGGGQFYVVNGVYVVVYDVGNGLKVYYDYSAPGSAQQFAVGNAQQISSADFYALPGLIHGGMVQELASIKDPSFQAWFDKTLTVATGGASWMTDPEMRKIYANWIVNPEISQEEIQAQIRATSYWQNHTDAQRQYQNASPADQAKMDAQAAADLVTQYFNVVGQQISITDPQLQQWAHAIASGTQSEGYIIESYLKPIALQNPQSPWSRTIQNEEEAQRQRGVDVGNKTADVQDLFRRWGVALSQAGAQDLANKLVTKQMSDADVLNQVKTQANVLYPWKPPDVDTETAAGPWLQTYARVLEQPVPELSNDQVQRALTSGMPVYQFEQQLRSTPQWLQTKNASETLSSVASEIGKRLGYEQ